jgi:hypothetical protein
MTNRLAAALNNIAHEHEAPIYALERLRFAIAEDRSVAIRDARRLEALNRSGEGPAFGAGWADFLVFARAMVGKKKAV